MERIPSRKTPIVRYWLYKLSTASGTLPQSSMEAAAEIVKAILRTYPLRLIVICSATPLDEVANMFRVLLPDGLAGNAGSFEET